VAALELLSQPAWQRVAWTLVHFVWQGAIIGAALWLLLFFLNGAHSRYATALVAFMTLIACPIVTLWTLQETIVIESAAPVAIEVSLADLLLLAEPVETPLFATAQPYLVLAWLTGVTLLSARLVAGYVGVRRLRASGVPLHHTLLPEFHKLALRMRVSRNVKAVSSHLVCEALVVGLWRPLILIPAAWITEMPAQTLEAVLAHELAHVRRHDLWVNLLQRVVETLLFYHPAVWYVSRVLRVEREKCCDELAVAATGERLVYVEALQLVAHRRLAASPAVWATAMGGARKMNLLERVRNVLGLRPETSASRFWPVGVAALVLPVGLWCATIAMTPTAQADDDNKDKPAAEKEKDGERKDGERKDGERKEGERKDGERKDGERKEGERKDSERKDGERKDGERRPEARREGDRPGPRDGERREGDRPGPRDGERRPEARREGDRPGPRDGERREGPGPRDGERREGDRPGPRDGDRSGPRGPRDGDRPNPGPREGVGDQAALAQMIMELRQEVMQLRREVHEMRQGRGGDFRGPEAARERPRGEGDRPGAAGPRGERREGPERFFTREDRQRMEQLQRALREAKGSDETEAAERALKDAARALEQRVRQQAEKSGAGERREGPERFVTPEDRERMEKLHRAVREAEGREAIEAAERALKDAARALEQKVREQAEKAGQR
jgi:beta-lactamase regulating signal transducer with metallopeptidase domain